MQIMQVFISKHYSQTICYDANYIYHTNICNLHSPVFIYL